MAKNIFNKNLKTTQLFKKIEKPHSGNRDKIKTLYPPHKILEIIKFKKGKNELKYVI